MSHLEILFKEYDMLRQEINLMTEKGFQLVSVGGTLAAALLAWLARASTTVAIWVVFSALVISFFVLTKLIFREISVAAARVQVLEERINQETGAHLLEWETDWGAAKKGYVWRRSKTREAAIEASRARMGLGNHAQQLKLGA